MSKSSFYTCYFENSPFDDAKFFGTNETLKVKHVMKITASVLIKITYGKSKIKMNENGNINIIGVNITMHTTGTVDIDIQQMQIS